MSFSVQTKHERFNKEREDLIHWQITLCSNNIVDMFYYCISRVAINRNKSCLFLSKIIGGLRVEVNRWHKDYRWNRNHILDPSQLFQYDSNRIDQWYFLGFRGLTKYVRINWSWRKTRSVWKSSSSVLWKVHMNCCHHFAYVVCI